MAGSPFHPIFGTPIENMIHFGGSPHLRPGYVDYKPSTNVPFAGSSNLPLQPGYITPLTPLSMNVPEPPNHFLTPVYDYQASALQYPFDWTQHGFAFNYVTPGSIHPAGYSHCIYNPFDSAFPGYGYPIMPLTPMEQPSPAGQPGSSDMCPVYSSEDKDTQDYVEESFVCNRCNETKVGPVTLANGKYCKTCVTLTNSVKDAGLKARRKRSGLNKDNINIVEVKHFTCSMCDRQKLRKHYVGGKLCCRECYHNSKPQVDQDGNKCANCSAESSKTYYRSKLAERLCHNCFHYKRRTGVSRPF